MSYRTYSEYLRHPKFREVVDEVFRRAGGRCENEVFVNGVAPDWPDRLADVPGWEESQGGAVR